MSPSEALQDEIRAARPAAPAPLRERVRLIAVQEEAREPLLERLRARFPRPLVAVPAALALVLVALGVVGLTRIDRPGGDQATAVSGGTTGAPESMSAQAPSLKATTPPIADTGAAVAPLSGRLQHVEAELRLRVEGVDELSAATQEAQRIASGLGGHVASLQYDAPSEGVGGAQLVLRIPVGQVETAMRRLSALGTILGQRFALQDLQETADSLDDQIVAVQRRVIQLRKALANPSLGEEQKVVLQSRLSRARSELAALRTSLTQTRADARLATIQLSFTTERIAAAAPRDDSALDRARDLLVWEGVALLFGLIVLGPFLLLAVAFWLALRVRRRREEARLLATS